MRALLTALGTMLVMAAITFVLWLGARRVLAGQMTGGQLGQFLLYAVFVSGSAAALIEQWGEVQRAAGAMERLVELLQARAGDRRPCEARRLCRERVAWRAALRAGRLPLPVAAGHAGAGSTSP